MRRRRSKKNTTTGDHVVLLTLGEAARRLGVQPTTLHELIASGRLVFSSRDEHGRLWFDRAAVDRCALFGGFGAGKAIDDGRPPRARSATPRESMYPVEEIADEPSVDSAST